MTDCDSAVLLPASDCSSGICTRSLGRGAASLRLLDLDGGVNEVSGIVETEFLILCRFDVCDLWDSGGDESGFVLDTDPTSTDCERLPFAPSSSFRGLGSAAKDARC